MKLTMLCLNQGEQGVMAIVVKQKTSLSLLIQENLHATYHDPVAFRIIIDGWLRRNEFAYIQLHGGWIGNVTTMIVAFLESPTLENFNSEDPRRTAKFEIKNPTTFHLPCNNLYFAS